MNQNSDVYANKWLVLATIGMGIFLATVDGSIVNVALPTLVNKLGTDFSVIQWVVLSYLLTVTTLMLSIGRLGDMLGKKKLYGLGFILFTSGSLLCGLSPNVYWLIGFRVFQGVGAALIMALGMALVTEAFPPNERGKAIGICGAIVSVGIAIGPSLGGVILNFMDWQWIFLVNLPIGVIGTYMVFKFVFSSTPLSNQKFDYPGATTLFLSLLSLLVALTFGQQNGFNHPLVLVLAVSSAVFLFGFIRIEQKSSHPMMDLSLFKNRRLSVNLFNAFIAFIGVAGTIILLPFYLQNILNHSTIVVGLLLCVIPVTLGIASPIAGNLSDKFGSRYISTFGLVIVLFGFYTASTLTAETTIPGYILKLMPLGLGMGIFQSPNNSSIMGAVPKHHLGIASGMISVSRTLGQTIGTSVLGTIWAGRVFFHAGHVHPDGATRSPEFAQISALQETFWITIVLIAGCVGLSIWKLFLQKETENG